MEYLTAFFNSGFFVGAATIVTGLAAWIVYVVQQKANKKQAARVLLTEIRIATERFGQIRDKISSGNATDFPPAFPTKSWKNYSHLFISDFDQDELDKLNSFYDYGELIEELAKRDNDFFWTSTEERAKVTVQKVAEFSVEAIAKTLPEGVTPDSYVQDKYVAFNGLMNRHNLPYTPSKMTNTIKVLLEKIPDIITSSTGIKLKRLAGF